MPLTPSPPTYSRRTILTTAGTGLFGSALLSQEGRAQSAQNTFVAHLAAANVPPSEDYSPYTATNAFGVAVCQLYPAESILRYAVGVTDMTGITGIHVHQGGPTENGPHLVELTNYTDSPTPPVAVSGTISKGMTCPNESGDDNCLTQGVDFETVVEELRAGTAYVQVHAGSDVIRGQLE